MPTDWVEKNTLALVAQINQFVTALNTGEGILASGLTAPQLTALGTLGTDLDDLYTAQLAAEAAFRAAVDATQAGYTAGATELRLLGRAANNYTEMTDEFRNAAGLTIRDTEPTPGALPVIDDLAVVGRPNGNNFLDWGTPAGVASGIVWEVQGSLGVGQPFAIVGAVTRTDFLHESAGAGTHRIYRVVATRGDQRGEPGNEAAVYG
ncbi:MAG: hypothetical protein WD716_06005 [Fimbriimonadaceae bacterium]